MAEVQTPPPNPDAERHAAEAQAEADRLAAEQAERQGDSVQVRFLRPLSIGGVDYSVGVHSVPRDAIDADGWFFEQHAKDGNVQPADELAEDGKPTKLVRAAAAKKTTKR